MSDPSDTVESVVDALLLDLASRHLLGGILEQVDADTLAGMRRRWIEIVQKALRDD